MRVFFRLLAIASLAIGLFVVAVSLMVAGLTLSAGLVVGVILVLYGLVRLYGEEAR